MLLLSSVDFQKLMFQKFSEALSVYQSDKLFVGPDLGLID